MSWRTPAARQASTLGSNGRRRHRPDYTLLVLSIIMLVIGLIVVYAISPGLSAQKSVSENYFVTKQSIAIGLGILTFLVTANMQTIRWKRFEKPLIFSSIAAAVIIQAFGEEVNGAARWIQIGGLSFQAVELIKFTVLIWLAGFLSDRIREGRLNDYHRTFKPVLVVMAVVSVVVAILQSDLGSTGVVVAIMGGMAFVAGLPLKRVLMFIGIIAIGTALAISSSAYRRDRLLTFMQPERDCQNAGYQACQALIAIGSGGMFGRGLERNVQAYGYQPEAANDSIFAIYGEIFGYIGSLVLLGLFVAFFSRLKNIMERAPDTYSRLIVAGVLAWLSTQALINIGAMIGLLPLKGITLPFISYGGTSIIFVTAAVGLAFNVSRYTTYTVNNADLSHGSTKVDRRRKSYATAYVSRRPQ